MRKSEIRIKLIAISGIARGPKGRGLVGGTLASRGPPWSRRGLALPRSSAPYSEYCSTTRAICRAQAAQNGLSPLLNMMQSTWQR